MSAEAPELVDAPSDRVPIFTGAEPADVPYEVALWRRASELDVSYAVLYCALRALTLGRTLWYDPATHELVTASADGEARQPAGRFERWAP